METMRPEFANSGDLWIDDGTFRDIYLQNMTPRHWQLFDEFVRQYQSEYSVDGGPAPFPGSAAIFANRRITPLLAVGAGQTTINCHFFSARQLELDVWPREIIGVVEHNAILSFVEQLSLALSLAAEITWENSATEPLITFSPGLGTWKVIALRQLP